VRRLYSTFADGWPGAGLLAMRLVVGAVLFARASLQLSDPPLQASLSFASLAAPGLLLVIGLWTPLAGIAVAAIEIFQISIPHDVFVPLLTGTVGGALAMLGPGRWSVDARLFGWKRIDPHLRGRSSNSL
jgi:putative oxidoreductase